jgi:hypothetical protein
MHKTKNGIQIMHFCSDELSLKLTKILEIENKGELLGVCSDIPPAKMVLPQNIFGLFVLKHRKTGGVNAGFDNINQLK